VTAKRNHNRHLYFAYGSNLNLAQMLRRCPGARPICSYRLMDWRLEFRGYADIAPCLESYVDGALYEIGPNDLAALDRYEGCDTQEPERGLYRQEWVSVEVADKRERALVYVMNRTGLEEPDTSYFDDIVQGFRDWGLPLPSLFDARTRAEQSME
jgi:gamma-glutamylcyclotransferase (GGCT)/AIG2-like uncharacterized protein YtfP